MGQGHRRARFPACVTALHASTGTHRQPLNADLEHIWHQIQADLSTAVDDATYRIWLQPLEPHSLSEDTLTVLAPAQTCAWVRNRFGRLLQTTVAAALDPAITVDVISLADGREGPAPQRPATRRTPARVDEALLANPKLTFDQFVIGDSNRLAHAAALTVAEMPAQAYNPLFICGPPGVGKTHLLGAISSLLLAHDPSLVVRSITGEQFTTDFLGALSDGSTGVFKARFRLADVLLIDDVQFLERKARTEEEFFHTFNSLYDAGSQLVLTSDRPPRNLSALEDRLRERFAAGLVADIHPPDRATRLAILRKRAAHDGVQLADEAALHTIAERITVNVRALEGALIRVVAFASLTGRRIDSALASEVLDGLYPDTQTHRRTKPASLADIQEAACEHFGVSAEDLLSSARSARIAWPRQVAMYLAREITSESLPAIGRHFGGRDHTTVLHAWRRTGERISADASLRAAVDDLRRRLERNPS